MHSNSRRAISATFLTLTLGWTATAQADKKQCQIVRDRLHQACPDHCEMADAVEEQGQTICWIERHQMTADVFNEQVRPELERELPAGIVIRDREPAATSMWYRVGIGAAFAILLLAL